MYGQFHVGPPVSAHPLRPGTLAPPLIKLQGVSLKRLHEVLEGHGSRFPRLLLYVSPELLFRTQLFPNFQQQCIGLSVYCLPIDTWCHKIMPHLCTLLSEARNLAPLLLIWASRSQLRGPPILTSFASGFQHPLEWPW